MPEGKSEQNKQVLIILVMVIILAGFLFFKMASSSKVPSSQGGKAEDILKPQDLESTDVGYVPEGIKDPFKLPRDMFKSPDEEGPDLLEDTAPQKATELPTMAIKGVILSDMPSVIIDNKVIKKGESVYDAVVSDISKEKIVFQYKGKEFEVSTPIMETTGFTTIPELSEQEMLASEDTLNVNITGNVIFEGYKKGQIVVIARTSSLKDIKVELPAPGPFRITLPKDSGNLYLSAINIQENKSLAQLPFGAYPKNPITVGKNDIDAIEITLRENKINGNKD